MRHTVKYNSQRDNKSFGGTFKGSWQCFTTCAWMFMSFYSNKIDGADDEGLAEYLDDVETRVGKPGIGEQIKRKYSWITGGSSFWWLVQQAGINKWMGSRPGWAVYIERKKKFEELKNLVAKGPVILQTKKIGGLRGGHIILIVGYVGGNFIVHDPYGYAYNNYRSDVGEFVEYPETWLKKYAGRKIRCIYWSKESE